LEGGITTDRIDRLLAEVFAGVFNRDIDVSQPLTRENLEDWDSLKHLEIIFAVEAATGLVFSEEQIMAVKSIDDLRRMLGMLRAS
jgi:acyl carrier protein